MSSLLALILFGILQGITEFLPVSSSGHLVLFQYLSQNLDENLSLNVAVHLGTLLTVLVYYRSDISRLISGFFGGDPTARGMVVSIVLASVPTGVVGLLVKKKAQFILLDPYVASGCLFITGLILLYSSRLREKSFSMSGEYPSFAGALLIGIVQGVAVLPGISRSGSTIVAGMLLGMSPRDAARFSFLMSVPAILGAGLLEVLEVSSNMDYSAAGIGLVSSFFTGLLAIHWMVELTAKGKLKHFSYYLFTLSLLFLVLLQLGWGKNIL